MDGQNQKISQAAEPSPVQQPPAAQPKPKISDAEAQALLAVNNLQARSNKPKDGKKVRVYVSIVIAIVISILLALFLHGSGGGSGSSSGGSVLPSSNNPLNNGGSINQQVQYCSNPINASLVC